MKSSVISRIGHLEARSASRPWRTIMRMGPLKQLPREYSGERHVVVVERCPCPDPKDHEYCRFEERPGPAPVDATDFKGDGRQNVRLLDIHLVRSPSDTEPEEQHWAKLTAGCRATAVAR
jgi:hypothetical protein